MCAKQVHKLFKPIELINELETRLREIKSDILPEIQPLRHFIEIKQDEGEPSNFFLSMSAYVPSLKCFGSKLLTINPGNANTDFPTHSSIVRLYESQHGQLLSEQDGDPITIERTAAVSAIAAKLLSREESQVLAVIGSGAQARSHIRYLDQIRDFKEIRVWSRKPGNVKSCIECVQKEHGIKTPLLPSGSAEEACSNADVIVTVTLSQSPVVRGSWLKEGALIVSVGACRPDWRELDDEVMRSAAIYVDNEEAAKAESGDLLLSGTTDAILGDIGWVLRESGRGAESLSKGKRFVMFKSLGMAIEDVIAAHFIRSKMQTK